MKAKLKYDAATDTLTDAHTFRVGNISYTEPKKKWYDKIPFPLQVGLIVGTGMFLYLLTIMYITSL